MVLTGEQKLRLSKQMKVRKALDKASISVNGAFIGVGAGGGGRGIGPPLSGLGG